MAPPNSGIAHARTHARAHTHTRTRAHTHKMELERRSNKPVKQVDFNIVNPETCNEDLNVEVLLNIEFALTFHILVIVALLANNIDPDTFNDLKIVALLLR